MYYSDQVIWDCDAKKPVQLGKGPYPENNTHFIDESRQPFCPDSVKHAKELLDKRLIAPAFASKWDCSVCRNHCTKCPNTCTGHIESQKSLVEYNKIIKEKHLLEEGSLRVRISVPGYQDRDVYLISEKWTAVEKLRMPVGQFLDILKNMWYEMSDQERKNFCPAYLSANGKFQTRVLESIEQTKAASQSK